MTTCAEIHLTPQYQLQYQWGGKYGGANCNPCSAGQLAQISSCGKYLFTGAEIRAASNEPIPDPASPGMNHVQSAAAVWRLSAGKVDLIPAPDYSFDSAQKRCLEGAPFDLSIRRAILVQRGQGYGNTFLGGHDITVYVENGKVYFSDPLTGVHETDWPTLKLAGGSLVINDNGDTAGFGRAWVMFGPDITADIHWQVHVPPESSYVRYTVARVNGVLQVQSSKAYRTHTGFSPVCSSPRTVLTASGKATVQLVKILKAGSPLYGVWLSARWASEV